VVRRGLSERHRLERAIAGLGDQRGLAGVDFVLESSSVRRGVIALT